MRDITLKELLEAGCHFGHQVTRQNPKAREFIFQAREGVHIIDLAKTRENLIAAGEFVQTVAKNGGTIVFVGTKRQARSIVLEAAKKARSASSGQAAVFVVTERWVGGTLTNIDEVTKNYKKLHDLRAKLVSDEEKAKYTKKEVGMWDKERVKLDKFYAGIADLTGLPQAIFIVDTHKEDLAVREANRTGVPVVGIVDANADPTKVDYPIPANDDAVGSVQLIVDYITDAWLEGKKEGEKVRVKAEETAKKEEEKAQEEIKKKEAKTAKKEK